MQHSEVYFAGKSGKFGVKVGVKVEVAVEVTVEIAVNVEVAVNVRAAVNDLEKVEKWKIVNLNLNCIISGSRGDRAKLRVAMESPWPNASNQPMHIVVKSTGEELNEKFNILAQHFPYFKFYKNIANLLMFNIIM